MVLRRDLIIITLICELLALLVLVGDAVPQPWHVLLGILRALLGLVFVLFLPGYALQAAVFAHPYDIDKTERMALAFGLSLAVIPLVTLLLDKLPWGIRQWPILIAESSLILVFSLVAVLRGRRIINNKTQQSGSSAGLRFWWASQGRQNRFLYGIMVTALLTGSLASAAILLFPGPANFYTEFYMLGPHGMAESYPREVKVGQNVSVTLGITNRERSIHGYRVEVQGENPQTSGKQLLSVAGPFFIDVGQKIETLINWRIPWVGQDQVIDLLLFDDMQTEPYRRLRLYINVSP